MALTKDVFNTIRKFIESEVDGLEFAILFGSHALKQCALKADIDFKIFLKAEAPNDLRGHVADFAQKINKKNSGILELSLSDVPYKIKTIVNKNTLENAIKLTAFININGVFDIPKVSFTRDFLVSEECQMRTVLSSLTTPNILIAGSFDVLENTRKQAFDSVKKLICNVYDINIKNCDQIAELLLESPDGKKYKNYLGYNKNEEMRAHLLKHLSVGNS